MTSARHSSLFLPKWPFHIRPPPVLYGRQILTAPPHHLTQERTNPHRSKPLTQFKRGFVLVGEVAIGAHQAAHPGLVGRQRHRNVLHIPHHTRVGLIITTNLKFADWRQVFGDEHLTLALLDRLTHRAHIVEFVGDSYRFRQGLQREEQAEVAMSSISRWTISSQPSGW
ncbi:MAG: ATP-binding protein [Anaerolineales bacterium]|nr:MAG: ATP-binding protein [Anaerolineales bacterium]